MDTSGCVVTTRGVVNNDVKLDHHQKILKISPEKRKSRLRNIPAPAASLPDTPQYGVGVEKSIFLRKRSSPFPVSEVFMLVSGLLTTKISRLVLSSNNYDIISALCDPRSGIQSRGFQIDCVIFENAPIFMTLIMTSISMCAHRGLITEASWF